MPSESSLPAVPAPFDALAGTTAAPAALVAAALEQLTEGVIVTDPAGRIRFVNDAAARLHGVARLDVGVEDYAASYRLFTEDGRPYPSAELPLARAVLRGETVVNARWRIRRPDGSEILAVGSARPVLGPAGERLGAVLTLRDDSARADAERAERRAAAILERVGDAHVALDHELRYLAVNAAAERVLGRPRQEIVGRTLREAFPDAAGSESERQYRRVAAEGVEAHFAEHYVGDGLDVHIEVDAYPTEDGGGGGSGHGVAVFWRDVTSRDGDDERRRGVGVARAAAPARRAGDARDRGDGAAVTLGSAFGAR
jgi:PAS domain S-box-containing protein